MAGAAQSGLLAWWVPAIYSAASFATFLAYAWDKVRAIDGEWRVSEGTLHWLEFFGGWPGALIAQQFFRHKTSKADYQITFWLIVAAHVGSWLWWVFGRGKI